MNNSGKESAGKGAKPSPGQDSGRLGLWHIAEDHPDRIAIIDTDGSETTFGELLDAVQRLSQGLRALGLVHGDAIAAGLPNCQEFILSELASLQTGFYFVPVNCHLAFEETAHIITDSESAVLVAHERFADLVRQAADKAGLPAERRFAVGTIPGFRSLDELMTQPPLNPDERTAGARMAYTSGTTGMPKGVRRALQGADPASLLGTTARITATGFGNRPGPGVCLTCGPLHHAGPSMMSSSTLHVGHTQVLMDKWTPEGCLTLIDKHGVTCAQMVPTMFHRMLKLTGEDRKKYDLSTLVSIVHTGAPCPVEIKQRMMDWLGAVIFETYGGTEGAATIATPWSWLKRPGTVGKPIHGVDIKIFDENGNECTTGEIGDVYFRSTRGGPKTEYYKDPAKTKSIWRDDYLTLGDMGYLDEDGFLFLRDRKKDMIISGGVNIFPAESEAILLEHPSVGDVGVIGIPDTEWGEQVKAVVEPAPGVDPSEVLAEELITFCRERLAHYKCPRTVDFRASLPRAENGKLYKRQIRDEYWQAAARSI